MGLVFTAPFIHPSYRLLISAAIAMYLITSERIGKRHVNYALTMSSFLLATASLIKFSAAPAGMSVILLSTVVFIRRRQFARTLYAVLSFVVSLTFLWTLAGQEPANLPAYFLFSLELAGGYGPAMSKAGPSWHLYAAIFHLVSILCILAWAAWAGKRGPFLFTLIFLGIIFTSFKHGLVRSDPGHLTIFFANMVLFAGMLYISNRKELGPAPLFLTALNLSVLSVLFIFLCIEYPAGVLARIQSATDVSRKVLNIKGALRFLSDTGYRTRAGERARGEIRKRIPLLEETLGHLRGRSVDIFPWEVSLAHAYGLNWSPRAVFQSYQANTDVLDMVNARHYRGENPPDSILYSWKSLDGRYPAFDEPSTFREVLCRYRASLRDGEYVLLDRRKKTACGAKTAMSSIQAEIGEKIAVPHLEDGYVFAAVDVEYTLQGKTMALLYKPAHMYITIVIADGGRSRHRFVPNVAGNGIFLSQHIYGLDDLSSVFSGNIDGSGHKRIAEIVIDTDNRRHYGRKLNVRFIRIPADVSSVETAEAPLETPPWGKLKRAVGGLAYMEKVNEKNAWLMEDITVDLNREGTLTMSGWAVDDVRRNPGGGVYLVFGNGDGEKTFPAVRAERPDVAESLGGNGYRLSGWWFNTGTEDFPEGCYSYSLRILRDNAEEYLEPGENGRICFQRPSAWQNLKAAKERFTSVLSILSRKLSQKLRPAPGGSRIPAESNL
jgi:hypothetical protein